MNDNDLKNDNLHYTTLQIVILQVVKLPRQLPGLPYQSINCNFLKSLMRCDHLFAFISVQYKFN